MSSTSHPLAQLSAYLDEALAPSEQAAVAAHLDTCAQCRARLAELRATAALIRSLPEMRPSRRLVPRIAAVPAWLAPLRTLSTLASAVSVFVFLAITLTSSVHLSASAPAAAPAGSGGAAALATSGPAGPASAASGPSGAADTARSFGSPVPVASPAPGAFGPVVGAGTPAASDNTSRQKSASSETPSQVAQFSAPSSVPESAERGERRIVAPAAPIYASPWLWLAIAVISAAIAIALQRRLRSV